MKDENKNHTKSNTWTLVILVTFLDVSERSAYILLWKKTVFITRPTCYVEYIRCHQIEQIINLDTYTTNSCFYPFFYFATL